MPQQRPCPLCSSSSSRDRFVKKNDVTHRYSVCNECGFLYLAEPNIDTVSHDIGVSTDKPHVRHAIQSALVKMWSQQRDGKFRVLEIGAGTGIIGKLLKDSDAVEYIGYEPSEKRAAIGTSNGIEMRCGFYDPMDSAEPVDCFIFDNVLEHVLEPATLFGQCASRLSEGGKTIVIVPGRYDFRRVFSKWRYLHYWQPHSHLSHFRRRDVVRMMRNSGLKAKPVPFRTVVSSTRSKTWWIRFLLDKVGLSFSSIYLIGERDASLVQ